MKKDEIIEKSISIVIDYYNNDFASYFDAVAEDVLWIGPRGGQIIHGKENIIKIWTTEEIDQRFSMGNITVNSVSTGRNNLEILLEYYVYTYFQDGESIKHHQRLHYSWGYRTEEKNGEKKRVPKICMIHISNIAADQKKSQQIYASSPSESRLDSAAVSFADKKHSMIIHARGTDGSAYYLNSADMKWIESTDSGRHSIIHSEEGAYKCMERLRTFDEDYSNVLMRVHSGYIINPLYVSSLRRFEVSLTDGTVLPVPQKKFTRVRSSLEEWKRKSKESPRM